MDISIFSHFDHGSKIEKGPKEIFNPEIQKDLLLLEEQEVPFYPINLTVVFVVVS